MSGKTECSRRVQFSIEMSVAPLDTLSYHQKSAKINIFQTSSEMSNGGAAAACASPHPPPPPRGGGGGGGGSPREQPAGPHPRNAGGGPARVATHLDLFDIVVSDKVWISRDIRCNVKSSVHLT